MIGVYKLINMLNGKVYIGQSTNLNKRYKEHSLNHKYKEYNTRYELYKAINEDGWENFKFEILEECEESMLYDKEIYFIQKYNSYIGWENSNGYNMTTGGAGTVGHIVTDEMRDILSRTHKGKIISIEHRKIISRVHKGNTHNIGRKASEETKAKMSNMRQGSNNGMYGKNHSDETRQKMSDNQSDKSGGKNAQAKRVICENIIYDYVGDCSDKYNVNRGTMTSWLNGKHAMPQEFIDKGLKYENEDREYIAQGTNKKGSHMRKQVICDNIIFESVKECADYYNTDANNMRRWLNKKRSMNENFISMGLSYYKE